MRTLLFLIPLALLAPGALADHCTDWSTSETTIEHVVIDTGTNDAIVHYVVIDVCQPDCLFSIWIYREYNGIPGLQRGDGVRDDTCHGMIDPDGFEF